MHDHHMRTLSRDRVNQMLVEAEQQRLAQQAKRAGRTIDRSRHRGQPTQRPTGRLKRLRTGLIYVRHLIPAR
jgi:hypothetical protein